MNSRLKKLKSELKNKGHDAVLVSSPANIAYLTQYHGFHGVDRDGFLFITSSSQYILTSGLYSEAVIAQVTNFKTIELTYDLPFSQTLEQLLKKHKINKLGIETDNLTVLEYKKIPKIAKLSHFSPSIIRTIKDEYEIEQIKKACKIGDKVYSEILRNVKTGITEIGLKYEIEHLIKQMGVDISFEPVVAFGKNSSVPHHNSSNKKLIKNEIVLLDFGVKFNGYCSDMTRTFFFGKAGEKFRKIYNTVLSSQSRAIEFLKSQVSSLNLKKTIDARKIDEVARNYIVEQGYPEYPHSLGHGIGLEVHEAPRLYYKRKWTLEPGMVFSIEPGIYIPGFGGVRIEDLVVLRKNKVELLTKSPKNLIEIL